MTHIGKNILDAEAFDGTSVGVEISVNGTTMRVSAETAIVFGKFLQWQGEEAGRLLERSGRAMQALVRSTE